MPVQLYNSLVTLALAICMLAIAGAARAATPEAACLQTLKTYQLTTDNPEAIQTAAGYIKRLAQDGRDCENVLAIYEASRSTGVDMDLLMLKAILESNIGEHQVAAHSSARGLFQFIEPTWLTLMKRYGADAGFPEYANAIKIGRRSAIPHLKGADEIFRPHILALRFDPYVSAYIMARQMQDEYYVIRSVKKSKDVDAIDYYTVHLLGLKLAREFYAMMRDEKDKPIAQAQNASLRESANLNRHLFFKKGKALNAAEAYREIGWRVTREMKNIAYIRGMEKEFMVAQNASEIAPASGL